MDQNNNIEAYTTTAEATTNILACSADSYETADNSSTTPSILLASSLQTHNFCPSNDVDWVKMDVAAGTKYMFMASSKGGGASMNLRLYRSDRTTLISEKLATNFNQSNVILYTPTVSQTVYLQITPFDIKLAGNAVQYTVWFGEGTSFYLPIIHR